MIGTYLAGFELTHEKHNLINDLVLQELDSTANYPSTGFQSDNRIIILLLIS